MRLVYIYNGRYQFIVLYYSVFAETFEVKAVLLKESTSCTCIRQEKLTHKVYHHHHIIIRTVVRIVGMGRMSQIIIYMQYKMFTFIMLQ